MKEGNLPLLIILNENREICIKNTQYLNISLEGKVLTTRIVLWNIYANLVMEFKNA